MFLFHKDHRDSDGEAGEAQHPERKYQQIGGVTAERIA